MKLLRPVLAFFMILTLLFSMAIPVHAKEPENEELPSIIDSLIDNMTKIEIDKEEVEKTNEALYGSKNPLDKTKDILNKFADNLAGKNPDNENFNWKADEIYNKTANSIKEVTNNGILDSVYNLGQSVVVFVFDIFNSLAASLK